MGLIEFELKPVSEGCGGAEEIGKKRLKWEM